MRTPPLLAAAVLSVALLASGCGDGGPGSTSAAAVEETSAPEDDDTTTGTGDAASGEDADSKPADRPQRDGIEIEAASSDYGRIVFDAREQAIYLFDLEDSSKSRCYDECAASWPPVLTDGEPVAGRGIDQDLLGTTKRKGGDVQATYNGHPLYYYVDDPRGEVLCHNVSEFGGTWLVVTPDGVAAA